MKDTTCATLLLTFTLPVEGRKFKLLIYLLVLYSLKAQYMKMKSNTSKAD